MGYGIVEAYEEIKNLQTVVDYLVKKLQEKGIIEKDGDKDNTKT